LAEPNTTTRFRSLADDAFEGLKEYYPAVMVEERRFDIYEAVRDSYADTGNRQTDYETLRDAMEAEAKRIEAQPVP
jgi:hypothetical protein